MFLPINEVSNGPRGEFFHSDAKGTGLTVVPGASKYCSVPSGIGRGKCRGVKPRCNESDTVPLSESKVSSGVDKSVD